MCSPFVCSWRKFASLALLVFSVAACLAQDSPTEQKPVRSISPYARLNVARTAFVRNGGGSDVPFNIVESAILESGRFVLVSKPEQADIIVEITSPEEEGGASKSESKNKTSFTGMGQKPKEEEPKEDKPPATPIVKLVVYDARTKVPLWSAMEQPKGGFKKQTRDDNVIESTQHLIAKLRQRIQPTAPANQ